MTFFECCEVVRADGLHMIRPNENTPGQYDLCESFEHRKGWIWLDAVTANLVCQVHDALSPDRQQKFEAMPAGAILNFCWKVASRK